MPAPAGMRLRRFSIASMSLCLNGTTSASPSLQPSQMEAWLSISRDDVFAFARDRADDPQVGLVAGGKDHCVVHAVEFAQRRFAIAVAFVGPVEHAAAGGAAAEIVERLLARRDHVGIESHPHVVVRAQQDGLAPVAHRHRGRDYPLHHQAERIGLAGGEQRFAHRDQRIELGEQVRGIAGNGSGLVGLGDAFAHPCSFTTASTSWP